MNISLLLPTRHRRENVERLYRSVQDTADKPQDIEIIIAVDDDDDSYDDLLDNQYNNMVIFKTPRQVLSKYWNDCYERASADILMHCGDDIVFRTKGWDTIVGQVFDKYQDKIVFVFGNDGSPHNGRFGTHGFISRRWVEVVGYFVPPYFSSDYNDTWLNDVAKMINRHIHVDIYTEHMHPDFDKADLDDTYKDRIERHQRDNVGSIYDGKLYERKDNANKLRESMDEN